MLSDEEVARYHENGYVTPGFRLSESQIESIRERHRELLQKHPEFSNYCPSLLAYDRGFLDVAKNNEILDMVAQLIGPDVALWNSSFFAKPAGGGHATPWHQDGEYWPIRPLATCTVWIALDPATPENGCLEVIPGSHKKQTLCNTIPTNARTSLLIRNSTRHNIMCRMQSQSYSTQARCHCTMFISYTAPLPTTPHNPDAA